MYPLRFHPHYRRYLWGGRRLATVLNKSIGPESAAESWEIVDHQDDQSTVAYGSWSGKSLRELLVSSGSAIVGESTWSAINDDNVPNHLRGRFPLLFKFLDSHQALSVQVHPDDRWGATLSPPDLGKTEAWYVMHADPGAKIFAGLKAGVTQADFVSAIDSQSTESLLHCFEPQVGDCVFIPAGTIHALGAGLVIAEIQQASNTTFRVFDWNRVDASGQSRPLHIEQAVAVTDFARGPVNPVRVKQNAEVQNVTLVSCDKFCLKKFQTRHPFSVGGDQRMRLLAIISGELNIENDPAATALQIGETILLPSSLPPMLLTPGSQGATWLEVQLP